MPSDRESRLEAEKAKEEAHLKTEKARAQVASRQIDMINRQSGKVPESTPEPIDPTRLIPASQAALQDAEAEEKAIDEKYKYELAPSAASFNFSVQIDTARFLIQLTTIILVTFGVILALQDRKT